MCIDIVRFIREVLFGPEDWSFLLASAPVGLEPGVVRAHYVTCKKAIKKAGVFLTFLRNLETQRQHLGRSIVYKL